MERPYRPGQVIFSERVLDAIEGRRIVSAMTYFDRRTGKTVVVVEAHFEREEKSEKDHDICL